MFDWYEIVGLIGATLIFTSGYIFDSLRAVAARTNRHLGMFIACSMCIGFWTGFIYCLAFREELLLKDKILFGCCISIFSYVIDAVVILIERATGVLLQKSTNKSDSEQNDTHQQ